MFTGVTPDRKFHLPPGNLPLTTFLAFLDETLFMPNEILKRFVKKYIDFHQKFAKIEHFKVGHSKKLLNFQNSKFLYRKSYSKFNGFL